MSEPICLCPASSEYDPPCPKHGVLGIGVTGTTVAESASTEEDDAASLYARALKKIAETNDYSSSSAVDAIATTLADEQTLRNWLRGHGYGAVLDAGRSGVEVAVELLEQEERADLRESRDGALRQRDAAEADRDLAQEAARTLCERQAKHHVAALLEYEKQLARADRLWIGGEKRETALRARVAELEAERERFAHLVRTLANNAASAVELSGRLVGKLIQRDATIARLTRDRVDSSTTISRSPHASYHAGPWAQRVARDPADSSRIESMCRSGVIPYPWGCAQSSFPISDSDIYMPWSAFRTGGAR